MARTNAIAVQGILLQNYDAQRTPDLTPFIDSASAVVDAAVSIASNKGAPLSTAQQEIIERWLSAHLYAVNDPLYMSRSTQGASGSFQRGQAGEGFASTDYGKQAMAIDTSGALKNINGQQRASGFWAGRRRPYCGGY